MTGTVYKNASGLPNDDQVTTARDQAILGRAIQERFPRYYKYFSIRSFTFRGQSISNHNHLLGRSTASTASRPDISAPRDLIWSPPCTAANVISSPWSGRQQRRSRDARMRELISEKIALASIKRTAPVVAEAEQPAPIRSRRLWRRSRRSPSPWW